MLAKLAVTAVQCSSMSRWGVSSGRGTAAAGVGVDVHLVGIGWFNRDSPFGGPVGGKGFQ
ncbi:MAG: hypothetical protein VYC91_05765 [Acidobacteriota bacterium]|nr:hypothetical protein [Acidobacteriota bacterium]